MLNIPLSALSCPSYNLPTTSGSPLTAFSSSPLSSAFSPSQQPLAFNLCQPQQQQPQQQSPFSPFSLNETANKLIQQQQQQLSQQPQPQQQLLDQEALLSKINSLLQQKNKSPQEHIQQSLLISTVLNQIQQSQSPYQMPLNPIMNFPTTQPEELSFNSYILNHFHHPLIQQQSQLSQSQQNLTTNPSFHSIQALHGLIMPDLTHSQFNSYTIPLERSPSVQFSGFSSTNINSKRTLDSLYEFDLPLYAEVDSSEKKFKKSGSAFETTKATSSARKTDSNRKEEKDPRSRSRFHNLTKLFLNSLLSIFTRENMNKLLIPASIQESVISSIARVKQSGRKTSGKVCKTDLFNHSHYNALFLKLTPESLLELSTKNKDITIHKFCFDIDINNNPPQHLIDSINQTKKAIFETTQFVLGNPIESESVRDEYWLRAIVGIKQLAEGKLIYRFQSITPNQVQQQQQQLNSTDSPKSSLSSSSLQMQQKKEEISAGLGDEEEEEEEDEGAVASDDLDEDSFQ